MVLAQGLEDVPVKLPAGAAASQSLNWGLGSVCRVAHHTALKLALAVTDLFPPHVHLSVSPTRRLLGCPHNMAADFPRAGDLREPGRSRSVCSDLPPKSYLVISTIFYGLHGQPWLVFWQGSGGGANPGT